MNSKTLHSRVGRWIRISVASIVLAGVASQATADDLIPPPWRGAPLTTLAEWDFLSAGGGAPDGPLLPVVGDGGGQPNVTPVGGIMWDPVFNGSWIGQTGGALQFYIPNWIDNEPYKDLWVQITYQPNPILLPPTVSNIQAFDPSGPGAVVDLGTNDMLIDPLNNLYHRTQVFRLFPNPDWESFDIVIDPDVVITQVVVDTISVPEPSTFVLAGICGALALVAGRRRFRQAK